MPPVIKKSFLKHSVLSSPYSLFGIPVSNSPPTPVYKKSRKAAARGRCQKRAPQAVSLPERAKVPEEESAGSIENVPDPPPMLECRVVLEKLDLFSLEEGVHLTQLDENSDPNVRVDPEEVSNRESIVETPDVGLVKISRVSSNSQRKDSVCWYDHSERLDGDLEAGPSSSRAAPEPSQSGTPSPLRPTKAFTERLNTSTSSEDSVEDSEWLTPGNSASNASARNISIMRMRGRRKLSKPCSETSHHLSTSGHLQSFTSASFEKSSNMSSLMNSSKLSALPKRRSLASINTSVATEHTTPSLRRRRSETQFSEFYMSALRKAEQLQVVAERMSWLKLAPLIMPEYPVDFEYIFRNWSMDIVSKLGEGSFSEVYRVRKRFETGDHFDVFKVIPVGLRGQPTFDDMLPEMSMCLAGRCLLESSRNRAPSFLSLRGTHLVQGTLTKEMVSAYEAFREQKPEETEHPHPSERQPKQFYVAFYTSYDGVELEKELPTLSGDIRASIVLQVTYALAAAELSFEFEHRDLHLSNIVIKETDEEELEFRICGESFSISSFGKRAALIDYGMCRLVVDEVLHSPFEPEILLGKDLQRKTYKKQHSMLGGNYHERCLETNGLWISFLIKKLFPKRPVALRLKYGAKVNRLFSKLCEDQLSARRCVEILENRELNETQSFMS